MTLWPLPATSRISIADRQWFACAIIGKHAADRRVERLLTGEERESNAGDTELAVDKSRAQNNA
jgi:hypothetical protein